MLFVFGRIKDVLLGVSKLHSLLTLEEDWDVKIYSARFELLVRFGSGPFERSSRLSQLD